MNDLVRVEEGQLIIAKEVIDKIINLENKKKQIDEMEKEFKTKLENVMEENGIKSFESNDKRIKISYTPASSSMSFDTKRFEKEHGDMWWEYQKEIVRKGSVRITIRDDEDGN